MPGWDETETSFRFRLREPGRFQEGRFRTKEIDNGISLVLGRLKDETTMTAQSIIFNKERFKDLDMAKKWLKDHGGAKSFEDKETGELVIDFAEPELHEIKDVEIFAAGTWNGDVYTNKHLDQIVDAFKKTKDLLKPYLKLGHSEEQALLRRDELPAAGFVETIRRVGSKIMADFARVPKKIYELIKKKAYNRISSEIFVNLKAGGEKYPFALKAVALLGGETPAVHNLDDIMALSISEAYQTDDKSKEYEIDVSYFSDVAKKEEYEMTLEELTKKNMKLEAEIKSLQEENAQLSGDAQKAEEEKKKAEEEAKAKAEEAEKLKEEKKNSEIEATVNKYVEEGKIHPSQGDILKTLLKHAKLDDKVKTFKINDKEYETINDMVKAFVDANEAEINTGDETEIGVNRDFVEKAEKLSKEKGITFKEAMLELSPEE